MRRKKGCNTRIQVVFVAFVQDEATTIYFSFPSWPCCWLWSYDDDSSNNLLIFWSCPRGLDICQDSASKYPTCTFHCHHADHHDLIMMIVMILPWYPTISFSYPCANLSTLQSVDKFWIKLPKSSKKTVILKGDDQTTSTRIPMRGLPCPSVDYLVDERATTNGQVSDQYLTRHPPPCRSRPKGWENVIQWPNTNNQSLTCKEKSA